MARSGRGHVDHHNFTIAVRRHVRRAIALQNDSERKGAADSGGGTLVAGEKRAKIVLVSNGTRRGVDHTDRVVVVVGNDERRAVIGDANAAGVWSDVQRRRKTDAFIGMTECDLARLDPGTASKSVHINRVVGTARRIERLAIGREDEAHISVWLSDHLREQRRSFVGARHVVKKDVLCRVCRVDCRTGRREEGVLASADDRQGGAIRAELRSYSFTSNKLWVGDQTRVQVLLNGTLDECRRNELARRQRLKTRVTILIALITLIVLIALIIAGLVTLLLIDVCVGAKIGTRRQSQQCRRCDCA